MDSHNKIIQQVANDVFSPMGFFQKGKSRTWLYDCGYCFVQVEFQPSAYSRGSFCNVGIAFLFEYFGGLNETLAFDYGRKRILLGNADFIEYTGDDEIFETQVFQLANNALKYAKWLMRFQSLKYGNHCMSRLIFSKWLKELLGKWNGPIYDYYNAAMIKFLLGKLDCGRRLIEKLNSLKLESPFKEWAEHSYSEFCYEELTAEQARNKVCSMINRRRNYFKQKGSFRKMPDKNFL